MFFSALNPALSGVYASDGLDRISKDVSSRIDFKVSQKNSGTQAVLNDLLKQPLTADSAVQIALLNNPSLQAVLESWGVAKADFNTARLPEKPVFGASVRFPKEDEPDNNVEFTVEQDFLSFVLFPLRSNLAGAELHKAELQITETVLNLAFEVKTAFYEAQGSAAVFSMRQRILEQADASRALAQKQLEAGNINDLANANEQSLYHDQKLELMKAEAELSVKRENLNRLLGFGGEEISWQIKDELPEISASEPSLEELFTLGLSKRPDLLIVRKEAEALGHEVALQRLGMLGHPSAGLSTEKDVSGGRVTGPMVKTEVPVYDLGQTGISRAGARRKEAELRLKALENEARSEIRQARDRLVAMRALTEEYKGSVIPVREKISEETQKHYNYMLLGNYDLIHAKQDEILAHQQYLEALRQYWIARAAVEKAVGANLVSGAKKNA